VQIMGRAARHVDGRVIMYADVITGSMKRAITEVERRRAIQEAYNKKHHITPKTIEKAVREGELRLKAEDKRPLTVQDYKTLPKEELRNLIEDLESQMMLAADNLEFEKATTLRDHLKMLKKNKSSTFL